MAELVTHSRWPTDDSFAAGWERLVHEDPSATVFHSARFLRTWCRYLQRDCDLRLRFLTEHEEVVGVVPEVREASPSGRRLVHFAGGEHVTDYLGPISEPDRRDELVDAWQDALAADDDWDAIVAGGLPEDAGWHELLSDGATDRGWRVEGPEREDVCPRIDLTGGWDAYLERLSGKQRHEIRRKARKLTRESGVVKLVAVDNDDLPEEVERFVTLHRTATGEKGRFFVDEDMDAFFHAVARQFGSDRTFRLHRLDIDGRPAAMTASFVYTGADGRREWGLYNSAFDREFGHLAPGMVLVGELIRLAAEDDCQVFDLLRGDEEYKYRFGAVARGIQRLTITRS